MVSLRRASAAALLAAVAASALAQSPLPLGARFPVNVGTQSNQLGTELAMAADGRFRVIWMSLAAPNREIMHRGFSTAGVAGAEAVLNQFSAGDQIGIAGSMNSSGDWIGGWISVDQFGSGSDEDVIVRRTSANGAVLEDEHRGHATSTPDPDAVLCVARHVDDSYIAVWREGSVISAHRFAANGASLGDDEEVFVAAGGFPAFDLAPLPLGRSILVVPSMQLPDHRAVGRFIGSDGAGEGFPFPLDEADSGQKFNLRVASDAHGGFVVTWENSGAREARRFQADGTPIGPAIAIHDSGSLNTSPTDLASGPDGSFVVVWTEGSESARDVYAREYTRTGSAAGNVFLVSTAAGDDQTAAAGEGNGIFAFAWQGPDASGDGIWARRYQRRVVFSDGFESENRTYWSSSAP